MGLNASTEDSSGPSGAYNVSIKFPKVDAKDKAPISFADKENIPPNTQDRDLVERKRKILFLAMIITGLVILVLAILAIIFLVVLRDDKPIVSPLQEDSESGSDMPYPFVALGNFVRTQPRQNLVMLGGFFSITVVAVIVVVVYILIQLAQLAHQLAPESEPESVEIPTPKEPLLTNREIGSIAVIAFIIVAAAMVAIVARVRHKARKAAFRTLLGQVNSLVHFEPSKGQAQGGKQKQETERTTSQEEAKVFKLHDYLDLLIKWKEKPQKLDPGFYKDKEILQKEIPMYKKEFVKLPMFIDPNASAFENAVQNMIRKLSVESEDMRVEERRGEDKRVYFFFLFLLEDLTFDNDKMGERNFVLVPLGASYLEIVVPKANSANMRDLRKIKDALDKYVIKLENLRIPRPASEK